MDTNQSQLKSETPPCADKLRFASRKEAEAAAVVADHQHGTKLKAYLCRHCEWWHLASQ